MGLFKKIVNAVLDNKVSPTRKDGRLDLRYKNAKTYQAAIQRKLDKDPELKEKFKEIEDYLPLLTSITTIGASFGSGPIFMVLDKVFDIP